VKLFLSPHNDDETLFGAFTILRESKDLIVAIVFDSQVQVNAGNATCGRTERRLETLEALSILGISSPLLTAFLGFPDDRPILSWSFFADAVHKIGEFESVYAPAVEDGGHDQHNFVGRMADMFFPNRVTHYMTYTNRGKSIGTPVRYEADWPVRKLRALACYTSQIALPSTRDHFLRDQNEYYQ
jgi:LmbE family N-acetylglucosaminyl deacetylase